MTDGDRNNDNNQDSVIRARDAEFQFPDSNWPILSHVNFRVPTGKITFVAGPSGVGKSTLLKGTMGMLDPVQGTLEVFGSAIGDCTEEELNAIRQRMGILYQSGALFQNLSLLENVMFPLLEVEQRPRKEAKARARKALEDVEISSRAFGLTPDRLSGGQRKRGGLARALVTRPELLLCDEPSSGLDPVTAMQIDELFLKLHQENPEKTIVIVSHDLHSIKKVADQIVFVHEHKEYPEYHSVRVSGPKKQILSDDDPIVREFFDRNTAEEEQSQQHAS